MALPANDAFTNTNGTELTAHGDWTYNGASTSFDIQSNGCQTNQSSWQGAAHWDADTFDDDQYAEGTIASLAGGVYIGVAVRCAASAQTFYSFVSDSGDGSYLEKYVAGSATQIGSTGAVFTVTDVVRLEVEGTTLTPMVDGSELDPPGAQTDATLGSGSAGVCGFGDSTSRIDDVEVGNLGSGTTYNQSAGGTLTTAGVVGPVAQKALGGAITPSGEVVKQTGKSVLQGEITPSGAVSPVYTQFNTESGEITPSGALAAVKVQFAEVGGELTPSGSVVGKALKALAGALTSAGALVMKTIKSLGGELTPSGEIEALDPHAIFCIGHETGDLTEYDSTVTDSGDLSVAEAAALGLSDYGLQMVIDDTTAIYGLNNFTQLTSDQYRFRFYVDPNGLTMADTNSFVILRLMGGVSSLLAEVVLRRSGGNYQIRLDVYDDGDVQQQTSNYAISDAEEHFIEVLVTLASSAVASDATATLWIDGVEQEELTGLDIFDRDKPDRVYFGAVANLDAGTSGTFYLDELCLRDDAQEIGPAYEQQPVAGDLTSSGSLAMLVSKSLGGSITPAGTVTKETTPNVLGGSITPSGELEANLVETFEQAEGGELTPSGSVGRVISKALGGSLTPDGTVQTAYSERLSAAQKRLHGTPVVTLAIGGYTLDAFVVAYKYEEAAEEAGSLAIWLDNREGEFNDLATDYPNLVRGAVVDLRRGLNVNGTVRTERLPDCWIDSLQYVFDNGAGLLLLDCIDWWGKLENFRYEVAPTWTGEDVRDIAEDILGQVGLTLQSGAFGYTIDHTVEVTRDGDEALKDVMKRVLEFLYTSPASAILYKQLDSGEAAGYDYDFSDGYGSGHPLLSGTEIAESSADFNKIIVLNDSFSGSAEDTDESDLVGVRAQTIRDESLTSNGQCTERAQAELSYWLARRTAGTLVARPHFTLRLYDVVSVAAPTWGGPALAAARVTAIRERYGFSEWEQEITIGDLPRRALIHTIDRPGRTPVSRGKTTSQRKAVQTRSQKSGEASTTRTKYAREEHTHDAAGLLSGSVGTTELATGSVTTAKLATDAVTSAKIAAGAVDTSELADNSVSNAKMQNDAIGTNEIQSSAVTAAKIAAGAVDTSELADGAVTEDKIATNAVTSAKIAAGAVDTSELGTDSVTAAKLAADTAGSGLSQNVTTGALDVNVDGSTLEIVTDTLRVKALGIGTSHIAALAVTAAKIANSTITSTQLANSAVTTDKIDNEGVTDAKMAADSVGTGAIRDEAVTCEKLSLALQALIGC